MIHTTSEPIPTEPAQSLPRRIHRDPPQAAPDPPRSNARSPTPRTQGSARNLEPEVADKSEQPTHAPCDTQQSPSPDTPDTAPSSLPPQPIADEPSLHDPEIPRSAAPFQEVTFDWDELTVAALDDTELHTLRNLVMAEDMRRRRARKRAIREEQE